MIDKDKSSISRYVTGGLKTVSGMTLKSAEIHTTTGLKTVSLLSEEQIVEVVTKYKPELLAKFAKLEVFYWVKSSVKSLMVT